MEGESVTSRYVSRSKFYVSLKVMRYECKAARPSWRLVDFRRLCFRDKTQGLPSPLASSVPFGECSRRLSMALRMRLLRQCPRPLPSGIVYPASPGGKNRSSRLRISSSRSPRVETFFGKRFLSLQLPPQRQLPVQIHSQKKEEKKKKIISHA